MTNSYPRSLVNPSRTAIQLIPSAVVTEFIDAFLYDMNEKQYAALAAMLLLLFSFVQNIVENKKGKALLKPSPLSAKYY